MTDAANADKTLADAAAAEAATDVRHELVNGELWAMAGGTVTHNQLSANLLGSLYIQLRGRDCTAFGSDQRVHIEAADAGLYPDAAVYCRPFNRSETLSTALRNPRVVVEVLSASSERYDRGRKFAQYQTLDSLQHYVLLNQDSQRIEVFDRNDDGTWTLRIGGPGDTLPLAAVECGLSVDEIYAGVELEPTPSLAELQGR